MNLFLIGIDHKTLPRDMREEANRLREKITGYWKSAGFNNTAVLSTCNRVEIYGAAGDHKEVATQVESFRRSFRRQFASAYIYYREDEIFEHGLRLACGLESQFRGEYQILDQIEAWTASEVFPAFLKGIWENIIIAAKEIRTEAGLNRDAVDIASLLFNKLKGDIGFKRQAKIIVIGTGKIAALLAEKRPPWVSLFFVARKKRSKAQRLVSLAGGKALLPEELPEHLASADAVISATSSPHYAVTPRHFNKAFFNRKDDLYIYDVATPRDVAPGVSEIPFVKLKDLDSMALYFSKENHYIDARIKLAGELIEEVLFKRRESMHGETDKAWNKAQFARAQAS